jgi:hypothetical protein
MAGVNRFAARTGKSLMEKSAETRSGTCVFVAHQFADLDLAIRVGEELKNLELDIWLDAEDVATQQAVISGDQEKLAQAIELGLCNCTHLLALI